MSDNLLILASAFVVVACLVLLSLRRRGRRESPLEIRLRELSDNRGGVPDEGAVAPLPQAASESRGRQA
jgi:hypothetical protein